MRHSPPRGTYTDVHIRCRWPAATKGSWSRHQEVLAPRSPGRWSSSAPASYPRAGAKPHPAADGSPPRPRGDFSGPVPGSVGPSGAGRGATPDTAVQGGVAVPGVPDRNRLQAADGDQIALEQPPAQRQGTELGCADRRPAGSAPQLSSRTPARVATGLNDTVVRAWPRPTR